MNINEYIASGIVEAYILGELSQEEAIAFEKLVSENLELKVELDKVEHSLYELGNSIAKMPPSHLEEQIRKSIMHKEGVESNISSKDYSENNNKVKRIQFSPIKWNRAAIWLLLAGSLTLNTFFIGKSVSTNQVIGSYRKKTNMMADESVETVVMHTILKGHPMAATLYWNKEEGKIYVCVDALPMPPEGMQYQLWVIQDGKPVDMGVLPNNIVGKPEMESVKKEIKKSDAFAISLEKKGGSDAPTAQNIYVMGKSL